MKFTSLQISGFRNLSDAVIHMDAPHITLTGNNGQGKSNFLEALYLICYGSSFRTRKVRELINHEKDQAFLKAVIREKDKSGKTGISRKIHVKLKKGAMQIFADGKEIKDRKELLYFLPCILFSHDDMSFVSGPPEFRRKFFNQTMCLYDPVFLDDIRSYNRILKQRNTAIKEHVYNLLPVYNHQLAKLGLIIQNQRKAITAEFNTLFPYLYSDISGNGIYLEVIYKPSWKGLEHEKQIEDLLEERLERDIRFQTTTSGPHRDKFVFMDRGRDFTATASTGQLRLISLVLRSAQSSFYKKKTGNLPILLLDDVLLELDPEKREKFLAQLEGYEQAVLTFLPDESYFKDGNSSGIDYTVTEGVIQT